MDASQRFDLLSDHEEIIEQVKDENGKVIWEHRRVYGVPQFFRWDSGKVDQYGLNPQ